MTGIGKLKSISECLKGVEFSQSNSQIHLRLIFKTINECSGLYNSNQEWLAPDIFEFSGFSWFGVGAFLGKNSAYFVADYCDLLFCSAPPLSHGHKKTSMKAGVFTKLLCNSKSLVVGRVRFERTTIALKDRTINNNIN
jgi:hypothetical protein